ncbi:MAG: hypothetical protein HKN37_06620, partial [Rhodothermales bacterium]|nr:hypothetical protein [Rhodothermales bacterium]
VYTELRRGMYGLPQAGRIANELLVERMAPHGYEPVAITAGLWRHRERDTKFTLIVDDFGVKYTSDDDAEHLLSTLRKYYRVTTDWSGTRYAGITLDWDYDNRTVDLSMPGYIERCLQRFEHPPPTRPEHAPHAWQTPTYGKRTQLAPLPDSSPSLDLQDTKRVQQIVGVILFYARAIDPTPLVALSDLATQQANPTEHTMKAVTKLLNYLATHPDAILRYTASDMCLWTHSDASYLSVIKARSRVAGYFFLSDFPENPDKPPGDTDPPPASNGAVSVLVQIPKEVLSSAAEAELAGGYYTAKEAVPMRILLEELGHPQPPTPLQTDNSTATGIANDTVRQRRSKAMDMRFYWIRDRVRQKQFHVYWRKGTLNRADYFTKHHPPSHHQDVRSTYLHDPNASRNYFEILQDDVDEDVEPEPPDGPVPSPPADSLSSNAHSDESGEGVLIPSHYRDLD